MKIGLIVHEINRIDKWLGRKDSNLRMAVPKTAALPLGYAPITMYAKEEKIWSLLSTSLRKSKGAFMHQ
jgi:hypothetical protein